MFVRVIPVTRTPPGVEYFDYAIPEGMTVESGDLLFVPFRKGTIVALAVSILKHSPFANQAKTVAGSYGEIKLPRASIELLDWIAMQTFSSRPAVLKSWLRDLPKRPATLVLNSRLRGNDRKPKLAATWDLQHQAKLIEEAKKLAEEGKRVLIVTPWKPRTDFFHEKLGGTVLHSDLNAGDAFRAWTGFLSGENKLMITTRVGAWMGAFADTILIDEPENDDHKQDEMAPRYDARKIAIWCAEHAGTDVHAFGLTPPLHVDDPAPQIEPLLEIVIRQRQGNSAVPCLQADTLNSLINYEGPCIVFHPIKGDIARLTCRDCGWQPECKNCGFILSGEKTYAICRRCGTKDVLPLECADCGGIDLGKSLPGIDRLKSAWDKKVDAPAPDWRTVSVADLERDFPRESLIVVTDPSLLAPSEDVRRQEKLAVAFRRLANRVRDVEGQLIIQTQTEHEQQWRNWLATEGFEVWRANERGQRALFGYPPMKRLIKIIVENENERLLEPVKKLAELRGPFLVPHRPKSRKDRYIWLAESEGQVSRELLDALAKLSQKALIDLDPIAFFR